MIYFFSDPHYDHVNICRGTSKWVGRDGSSHKQTRDFDTLEEMNDKIVNGVNSVVRENDELWCLGDWSFNGMHNIWEFRKRIKCKTVHLVFGNHDEHIEHNRSFVIPVGDRGNYEHLFEERMGTTESQRTIMLRHLFKSTSYYRELKTKNYHIILSHYAMRVWNKSHRGSIQLHGHSHGTLKGYEEFKTMDVGIDTTKNYTPYSLETILEIMSQRKPLLNIDHHDSETN